MDSFFDRHIFCCTNERPEGHPKGCCHEKDAVKLRNYMKARLKELGIPKTRVNAAGCLDRCALGPVMVIYPEGVWYHFKTREDIDEIIQKHFIENAQAERLILTPDQTALDTAISEDNVKQ